MRMQVRPSGTRAVTTVSAPAGTPWARPRSAERHRHPAAPLRAADQAGRQPCVEDPDRHDDARRARPIERGGEVEVKQHVPQRPRTRAPPSGARHVVTLPRTDVRGSVTARPTDSGRSRARSEGRDREVEQSARRRRTAATGAPAPWRGPHAETGPQSRAPSAGPRTASTARREEGSTAVQER